MPKASQKVIAPSIEGCIAGMKCTLDGEVTDEEKYPIINEKVVHLEIDDRYLTDDGDMDFENAHPLSTVIGENTTNILKCS